MDDGTKKLKEACEQLRQLAGEMQRRAVEQRRLMLMAIEVLLAGGDLLDEDIIKELEQTQGWMSKAVAAENEDAEDAKPQEEDDGDRDAAFRWQTTVDELVYDFWSKLDGFKIAIAERVVETMMQQLPEKKREAEAENAKDKAIEELLTGLQDRTAGYVERITTQIAREGSEDSAAELKRAS